jgi:hypothetical protein
VHKAVVVLLVCDDRRLLQRTKRRLYSLFGGLYLYLATMLALSAKGKLRAPPSKRSAALYSAVD